MVDSHGNAAAIVDDGDGISLMDGHIYGIAYAGQSLVHRIVHDFIHQVVQTSAGSAADVHAGTLPDCLQPLQDLDLIRPVLILYRRVVPDFFTHELSVPLSIFAVAEEASPGTGFPYTPFMQATVPSDT